MARKTVTNRPSPPDAVSTGGMVADPVPRDPVPGGGAEDALSGLAGMERRLHARAYHHWSSLLGEARFPSIRSLDPQTIGDFASNSVLLDFRGDRADPTIAYIGAALRDECAMCERPRRIGDLPERSLLARLTAHCGEIISNEAPAGFEAEFVNTRGHTTLYRGILLPYSSDGLMIDFVHGVVSWKEVADPLLQAELDSALLESVNAKGAAEQADVPKPDAAALWNVAVRAPETPDAPSSPKIARVTMDVDAPPGTPVVLVGHVDEDGVAVTAMVIGDARLADRVLRASH